MSEEIKTESVNTEQPKKKKKLPLWAIISGAAVVVAGIAAVLIVTLTSGAEDEWLRKALAEDSVRTIELNEDIKAEKGYEVNGTKTLVGSGKISMNGSGAYVFSVTGKASLTVDGVTLNVKNKGGNGVIVRAGGKLVWESGVISYPKQYAIMNYGDTTINGGNFEYAGSGWLYVKSGTEAVVNGGTFTKSGSAGFEVEEKAKLTIGGKDTLMERAGSNTVNNNGTLVMTGGTISQSEVWTITNHGECSLDNVTIKDCSLKGALYNYKKATAEVNNCVFTTCKTYQIYNEGTATVKNTVMENSNASTVNNKNTITLENVTIRNSNYHGLYNERGTVNIKDCTVDGTVYKAIQNKAGYVTIDGLETDNIGGVGVGNVAVTTGGNYGWIHATNMHIKGCSDYNFVSYGGEVSISNSTFETTPATSVYIRNGTGTLENVKVLGSSKAGKAAVALGSKAYRTTDVVISGADTYITGASRGITNYGKLVMKGGTITGNHNSGDQEVGGGVYNVGTFYLYGGTISNNSCVTYGGGVRNGASDKHYGVMYMYGGSVTGNRAGVNGGGISIGSAKNALYMYGGTVANNRATNKADGIMVAGPFHLYNGSISNNDVFLNTADDCITVKSDSISGSGIQVNSTSFENVGSVAVRFNSEAVAKALAGRFVCVNDQWSLEQQSSNLVTKIALNDIDSSVDWSNATVVTVSSFQQLKSAVESTSTKKVIRISANIPMTGQITVPKGASVKLVDDGTQRVLTRSRFSGNLFVGGNGSNLYMAGSAGLILDGDYGSKTVAKAALIRMNYGGMFVLEKGATLRNAMNSHYGTDNRAGALNLYGGRAIIRGGVISNCNGYGKSGNTYDNLAAVYVSTSGVLSIKDGSIQDGQNGAIRSYGRVYMSGGTIKDNTRTGDGGAALRAPVFVMSGGTISGNTCSNSGSAVYITKSSAYPNGYFRMTGGTITGNKSLRTVEKNASGGAVYIGVNCTFDMVKGEISHNVSGDAGNGMGGGGIYAEIATVNLYKDAVIKNNTAYNSGGGIYAAGTKLTIDGATISGNTAVGVASGYGAGGTMMLTGCTLSATGEKFYTKATVTGATIADNVTGNSGGIYVDKGNELVMSDTVVKGTKANGASASGYASASALINKSVVTLTGCTFEGNEALIKGAVYNDGADAVMTVTNCVFKDNVSQSAGALVNAAGEMTVTGSTFTGNTAKCTDSAGGNGGAVMNQSEGKLTMTNCTFTGNTAMVRTDGNGGEGGAVYNDAGTMALTGCTFSGNTARIGKDIFNSSASSGLTLDGKTTVSDVYLASNKPLTIGQSFSSAGKIDLTLGGYVVGNQVLSGAFTQETIDLFELANRPESDTEKKWKIDETGALVNGDGPVTNVAKILETGEEYAALEQAVDAAAEGQTIVLLADVQLSGSVKLDKKLTITTDGQPRTITAPEYTGSYLLNVTAANVTIKGTGEEGRLIIDGQGITRERALVCLQAKDTTLEYVTLKNNVCSYTSGGAGLYTNKTGQTLKFVNFENNRMSVVANGGGIYSTAAGSVTMTDCRFVGNVAKNGGAFYGASGSSFTATRCHFENNNARDAAGGVTYANKSKSGSGTIVLTDCTFVGNTAKTPNTASLYIVDGNLTMNGCSFDDTKKNSITGTYKFTEPDTNTFKEDSTVAVVDGTSYDKFDDALAAALESGKTLELKKDVKAKLTVSAGQTLSLSGAFTVTGDAAVSGKLCLTDTVISGDVTVTGSSAILSVAGAAAVTDGAVTLSEGGVIEVAAALTASKTAKIKGVKVNDQALIAPEATLISSNCSRFDVEPLGSLALVLDETGKVVADTSGAEAMIGTTSYNTLEEAIEAAQDGDTVILLGNAELAGNLILTKAITLQTDGKADRTITVADRTSKVYMVSVQAKVQLVGSETSRLILDGRNVAADRPVLGFTAAGSESSFRYVTVQNSVSSYNGGGVCLASNSKSIRFENCVLHNNESSNTGNAGGAMYVGSGASATMVDCTISDNKASAGYGGAFVVTSNDGDLTLTGCVVSGNTAAKVGGAAYLSQSKDHPAVLTATNTRFENNSTPDNGGVIRATGVFKLDGCTFVGNSGKDGLLSAGNATYQREVKNCVFDVAEDKAFAASNSSSIQSTGNEFSHSFASQSFLAGGLTNLLLAVLHKLPVSAA